MCRLPSNGINNHCVLFLADENLSLSSLKRAAGRYGRSAEMT